MKRLFIALAMLTMTVAASAQFETDKRYISASIGGLDLSYNGSKELNFDVDLNGGLFVDDNWLLKAQIGFAHHNVDMPHDVFTCGAGVRYYIQENGIFAGINGKAILSKGHNDIMPGIEVGYCYFLNGNLTVEPSVYYDQSLKSHSDHSTVGFKIGLGYYF